MNLATLGIVLGFAAAILVVVLTIWRQKRFDLADLGSFAAAFLTANNIPPAIFLCFYGLHPDPAEVMTKLHGYEKYVSYAGLSLLLVSLISIWGLLAKAYEAGNRTAPAADKATLNEEKPAQPAAEGPKT